MSIIEAVAAIAVLLSLALPLTDLVTQNGRAAHGAARRIVLELRARRHQAEVAATTYETALAAGGAFPNTLAEPQGAEGYTEHVTGVKDATTVAEIVPGLAEVHTKVAWREGRGDHARELEVRRLIADPTRSLRSVVTLGTVRR